MNIEKGPKIIRIVGGASEEKKEQAKKEIEKALFSHFESLSPEAREELEKLEYPKSEKELALIQFANEETSRLMQEAGSEPYNVPAENFHIIPPELYKKATGGKGDAISSLTRQGILLNAEYFRNKPVCFGSTVFHELLHLKGHLSMEVQEDDDTLKKTSYREGITVHASQKHNNQGKYHRHFYGLHEAIVAETQKRFLKKLLNHPELEKEREWLISDEAKEMRKKLATEKGISENDIIWIGKKGESDLAIIAYPQQRKVLNYVCEEIQKQFPDQYQRADDVYKVFLNAHFTGRLLPLARIVEKAFGEGSFRLLGNMEDDPESGISHLESLKKARARQMRKNIRLN